GLLMATPDSAWARRSRCCCQGYGYSYYGSTAYYGNSGQTTYSDGTAAGATYGAPSTYGTNYGPQGYYYGAPAQGYYTDGRHHHRGQVYGMQGGVDASGRPLPQTNAGARANATTRENDANRANERANPAPRSNPNDTGAGRTDARGAARGSTNVTPPPP